MVIATMNKLVERHPDQLLAGCLPSLMDTSLVKRGGPVLSRGQLLSVTATACISDGRWLPTASFFQQQHV